MAKANDTRSATTIEAATSYRLIPIGPADIKRPTIEIPEEAWGANQYSFDALSIVTAAGHIRIEFDCCVLKCRGSVEALAAYGLFRPEWAPGQPGSSTNKVRQVVIWTERGPELVAGKFHRSRITDALDRLTVVRTGKRFHVELPLTPEQDARRNEHWEKRQQEQDAQRAAASTVRPQPAKTRTTDPRDPDYQNDILGVTINSANRFLDALRETTSLERNGLSYSAESNARILRVTDELRRAFAEARLIPLVPKYHAEGNVIHFPVFAERRAAQ